MPQRQALIFANGEPNDGAMVRRTLTAAPDAHIIAADGGARVAWYYGRIVQTVIGDMDSLTEDELAQLEAGGASVYRYPPAKNETDLELALIWAAERGMDWLRIIGGIGDRFDQTLANVYLMALPQLSVLNVALVAGRQRLRLLRGGTHEVRGQPDDTISLMPVGGDVRDITTQGLGYALDHETLYFGPARGISNVMAAERAQITFASGLLLMIHTLGRA